MLLLLLPVFAAPVEFTVSGNVTTINAYCPTTPTQVSFKMAWDDAIAPWDTRTGIAYYSQDPSLLLTMATDVSTEETLTNPFLSIYDDGSGYEGFTYGGTPLIGEVVKVTLMTSNTSLLSSTQPPDSLDLADFDQEASWYYREGDTATQCYMEGTITGISSGPNIPNFTFTTNGNGSITATSTTDPSVSVTFPAGTTFPSGASITQTSGGGVNALAISGVTLPTGTTKTVSFSHTPSYTLYGYCQQTWVYGCIVDTAAVVDINAADSRSCAGTPWVWYDAYSYLFPSYESRSDGLVVWDFNGVTRMDQHYPGTSASWDSNTFSYVQGPVLYGSPSLVTGQVAIVPTFTQKTMTTSKYVPTDIEWMQATSLGITVSNLSHTTLLWFDDTDADGIPDADERRVTGTDPGEADSDGDGVSDGDELALGTNPLDAASVADADGDGDGMNAALEATLGTSPMEVDSDGDGVGDATELQDGTDPLDATSANLEDTNGNGQDDREEDWDGDGLSNQVEAGFGTDPADADSDGDGVSDFYEGLDGTGAADAGSSAIQDVDADQVDDRTDNCQGLANVDQADTDRDGLGDACEEVTGDDSGVVDSNSIEEGEAGGGSEKPEGCGCNSGADAFSWFGLLVLVGIARRKTIKP